MKQRKLQNNLTNQFTIMSKNNFSKVCLVVIFNHRFEKNIDKLKTIYSHRFTNIKYLMPFWGDETESVIKVYESSYFFQNHVHQAFIGKDFSFSHYIFIGDDLILNPDLNETNILTNLGVNENEGYIKELKPLNKIHHLWLDKLNVVSAFDNPGFDIVAQLPDINIQNKKFKQYGIFGAQQSFTNLLDLTARYSILQLLLYKNILKTVWRLFRGYETPMPIVSGYSDFFVIPNNAMPQFVHLSGIYGAMNLWVEAAIPTAMLLSCDKVITEKERSNWYGTEIWGKKKKEDFESNLSDLASLNQQFSTNEIYIHPIKLSKITL